MPSLSTTETSYDHLRCPRCELCELKNFGVKHKSTEHAFQYIKAVRNLDSANAIAKRDDALATLRLGRKVKLAFVDATYNREWGSCLHRDGTRNTKPERWQTYTWLTYEKIADKYGKETTETLVKSTANRRKKVETSGD